MDVIKPLVYNTAYRRANCCSKVFYSYIWELMKKIKSNNDTMDETMIEDMSSYDGETEDMVKRFIADYDHRVVESKKASPDGKGDHYKSLRNAVLRIFGPQLVMAAFYSFLAECLVIAFTTYMIVIIDYLKDEDI